MRSFALALCAFALTSPAYAKTITVTPSPDAQEALQLALLDAKPGDVVEHTAVQRLCRQAPIRLHT